MSKVERHDILVRVRALNVWRRGGVRAPHKPLLFLLAVSRLLQGQDRLVRFADIEERLGDLLRRYGPPRQGVHPEYPFWWLQSDGLWIVEGGDSLPRRRGSGDPTRLALRAGGVGGFPPEVETAFKSDRKLLRRAVSLVLHSHFPDSLHAPLLADLGISDTTVIGPAGRDSQFRREVLDAYGHCCAICGLDLRMGEGTTLALDAAHLKWHQAGGPDDVRNGLAVCAIHHRALDAGAMSLDDQNRVLVSGSVHGSGDTARWFFSFSRQLIASPHTLSLAIEPVFAAWHRREVFRPPARD